MSSLVPERLRVAMPPVWAAWLTLVGAVLLATTIIALTRIPDASVTNRPTAEAKRRYDAENALRGSILQLVGGFVVVVGLGMTARQLYLTRETHLTDRLSQAVEHLGTNTERAVGGMYALERLAKNSRADREMVADILTGYLRIHAPLLAAPGSSDHIGPDVQTALTILARLPR